MTAGTVLHVYGTVMSPLGTAKPTRTQLQTIDTVGVIQIPQETIIGRHYILRTQLFAEVKVENDKYVMVDYQTQEYGIGNSLQEATQDLLESMADYLASLEKREHRLGDRELQTLELLRSMIAKSE